MPIPKSRSGHTFYFLIQKSILMKISKDLNLLFILIIGMLLGATLMGLTLAFTSPVGQLREDIVFYKNESERLKDENIALQIDATICDQMQKDCEDLLEAAKQYRRKVEERWGNQLKN